MREALQYLAVRGAPARLDCAFSNARPIVITIGVMVLSFAAGWLIGHG